MSEIVLKTPAFFDDYTEIAYRMFDVPRETEVVTKINNNIILPDEWTIGLIYGPSGSGKTTLLKTFGEIKSFPWDNKPIISNFDKVSPEVASKLLSSVGLSSVPSWLRPFNCLSNGEQFRVNLARVIMEEVIANNTILIDEFTSVVDRNVAKAASNALQKTLRKLNKKCILSSCHSDIIEWLCPDWIYNPIEGITHNTRGLLRRPNISLKIFRTKYEAWDLFKHHHYLNNSLNKSTKCFLVTYDDTPVAFTAVLALPHGRIKNAWRESRTVVLPDYQGLGIGVILSDYIGSLIVAQSGSYYSRTTHPAMISYRTKSPKWKVTYKGKASHLGDTSTKKDSWKHDTRECVSFKYIGEPSSLEESKLFWEKV